MSTASFDIARQKSETVASVLRDIAVLIGDVRNEPVELETGGVVNPGLGFTNDAAALFERATDIHQGIFNLIVLGEFKNGKSTLLNALLGSKTLPAKATPATAIITVLVYGENKQVTLYETDKEQPRVLSLEEFTKEFQLTKEDQETLEKQKFLDRFQNVKYAQMECVHPICANGVKLVDSPGLGEHTSRTKVTTGFLKQAQAIIFVLTATKILSQDEKEFIQDVLGEGRLNHVFFVINRINLIEEEEVDDIKSYVRKGLMRHFLDEKDEFDESFYNRRVFFVNAKGALDERAAGSTNNAALEASGIPSIERELEQFLASDEKLLAALETTIQLLIWIIAQAREKITQQKYSLEQPLNELEKRRDEAEKRLKALEGKKDEIERTILLFGGMIKQKIYSNLMGYISEMKDTWPQDSREMFNLDEVSLGNIILSFAWDKAKKKISDAIESETKNYLEKKLSQWSERVPTVIEADISQMMVEVEAQVGDFQLELDRISYIFSGRNADDVVDIHQNKVSKIIQLVLGFGDISQMSGTIMGKGDWGSFFGRMLQQILVGTLVINFLGGPIGWIVFISLEAVHVGMQQNKFKERILENLGSKFHESLRTELAAKENEICQSVEKQFIKTGQDLTKTLQSQIDEVRDEQERIINQKQNKSFSVEQEKSRLDVIDATLIELFKQVSITAYGRNLSTEEIEQRLAKNKSTLVNSQAA